MVTIQNGYYYYHIMNNDAGYYCVLHTTTNNHLCLYFNTYPDAQFAVTSGPYLTKNSCDDICVSVPCVVEEPCASIIDEVYDDTQDIHKTKHEKELARARFNRLLQNKREKYGKPTN
jgi:hypothetical protein